MLSMIFLSAVMHAADYQSPDHSFTITVPAGWKATATPQFTVIESAQGRILVGSGVALANSIQELSQQAYALTAQTFPGAQLSAGPKFDQLQGSPMAEQEYRNMQYSGWNGMVLRNGFYFAVLAIAPSAEFATTQKIGRELLRTARFQGVPRNTQLEAALLGGWSKSSYSSKRSGARDKSNYSSSWNVQFLPGNRFVSEQQNYFDTESATYGGGNVGSSNRAVGTYRIFGSTLLAEIDGAGRQLYSVELYPNGGGVKLNGQLFLRQ